MKRRSPRILGMAALLSVPLVISTVFAAPAALAAAPASVSNLELSSQDAYVYVDWTASPVTPNAVVCYAVNTAPTAPTDSGATCSDVLSQPSWQFVGTDGTVYGVSVFSYDSVTKEYGTPVSSTVKAVDPPPLPPLNVGTASGGDDQHITLYWSPNPANHDTREYRVIYGKGLSPTSWQTPNYTIGMSTGAWISPLTAGTVYTFLVQTVDAAGHVSPYAGIRAATRQPGLWLSHNNTVGHVVQATTRGYQEVNTDASAMVQSDGIVRSIFTSTYGNITVQTFSPTNDWNEPGDLYSWYSGARHALIASAPRVIVAGWTANAGVYYATKTTANWAKPVRVSSNTSETLVGLAVDKARRVHLLVVRTAGTNRGLYYLTRYAGRTTRSFVAGSGPGDIGLLTRDVSTDKMVLVDRHRGAKVETVKVKVLAPTATTVGTMTTWLSTTARAVQWKPTAVAANGGRINVGMQRVTRPGSTAADGPYVVYGTATMHRSPTRVTGTSAVDSNLTVNMPTPSAAMLSWQRHNAGWSPLKLGVWVSQRTYKSATGTWSYSAPAHWTTSAYDVPVGAFKDAAGHTYVVYMTSPRDVVQ